MTSSLTHEPRRRSVWLQCAALLSPLAAALLVVGCQPRAAAEAEQGAEADATRIVTETAVTGSVSDQVSTTGSVLPEREVVIAAEGSGRVIKLPVSLGSVVKKGALLAKLDSTVQRAQAKQAHANLRQAEAALELAASEFARAETLHGKQAVSDLVLEQRRIQHESSEAGVEAARAGVALANKAVADCSVRAPFAGTVAEVHLELGALVAPGTPSFRLVSIKQVRVLSGVSGSAVGKIQIGMPIDLRIPSLGDRAFRGVVGRIGPTADPRTRTYPLEANVENKDGALRPGMMAKVDVILAQRSEVVLVPRSCIIEDTPPHVFVVRDGRAEQRSVTLGQNQDELVEVLSGIEAGEVMVSLGRQRLSDGDLVSPYSMPDGDDGQPGSKPATTARAGTTTGDAETD